MLVIFNVVVKDPWDEHFLDGFHRFDLPIQLWPIGVQTDKFNKQYLNIALRQKSDYFGHVCLEWDECDVCTLADPLHGGVYQRVNSDMRTYECDDEESNLWQHSLKKRTKIFRKSLEAIAHKQLVWDRHSSNTNHQEWLRNVLTA